MSEGHDERMRQAQRDARDAVNDAARWRDAALYAKPILAHLAANPHEPLGEGWLTPLAEALRLVNVAEVPRPSRGEQQ